MPYHPSARAESALRPGEDPREKARVLSRVRDVALSGGAPPVAPRPVIGASWRRVRGTGLDPRGQRGRGVDDDEVAGALVDIGFTIPGQAWTYWNMGPGPGPSYTETDHRHDWSERTGRVMAGNLVAAAAALRAHPLPAPN